MPEKTNLTAWSALSLCINCTLPCFKAILSTLPCFKAALSCFEAIVIMKGNLMNIFHSDTNKPYGVCLT